MTNDEKEAIRDIIKQQIDDLTNELTLLQSDLKPIKKDCSLDNIDHKILKQDQNITIKRFESVKKRLNRLKAASINIDADGYGVCKECEDDISIKRLKTYA